MEREQIRLQEYLSEKIIESDDSDSFYSFETPLGVEALERIYEDSEEGYSNPDNFQQRSIYNFLEDEFGLVEEIEHNGYEVLWETDDIEVLHDRLEQHISEGYDRTELVALLRAEYQELGELPTQTHFREQEHLPSEMPYKSRFGDWNSALYMAGLDPEETRSEVDELVHELIQKTHEMNEDTEFLIETPSARQINEDSGMHSETQFRNRFGSIEAGFEEAGLAHIREIEKDHNLWREIVLTPYSDQAPQDYSTLTHLYPSLT